MVGRMAKKYDTSIVKRAICTVTPITGNLDARYLLQVELHTPAQSEFEKTLTYVMMNPSAAEELTLQKNISDETVNKVIAFAHDHQKVMKVGKVNIVNLFGIYEPQSKSLQKSLNQIQNKAQYMSLLRANRAKVEDAIIESDYIVLGWGNVPAGMAADTHNLEVAEVYRAMNKHSKLDQAYVIKSAAPHHRNNVLTVKKRPRHPGRMPLAAYIKCKELSLNGTFLKISV